MQHPTPRAAPHPAEIPEGAADIREGTADIAIVGMSCRFPGGDDPETFYRALIDQRDLFSPPPRDRWSWCSDDRISVPRVGSISGVFGFDYARFRISPREAEAMDPHQRLMLEQTWLAIEDAGYTPERFKRRATGVFVAMYSQDFQFYASLGNWDEISRMYLATGSARSLVANRISYVFDLRGPSELVDTACSSALVAVHRAVKAITSGECEQAVVGGVSLLLEPGRLVQLQELGLLSPAGNCAPFDRDSSGQVLGEGAAAIVLKPLDAALRDRDTVHAVIPASGVNHQGASSGGLTRPSATAQADLIRRTFERNRIAPAQVDYVEAHGNGGNGDTSELLAFQDIFASGIAVGSVKGNIGFLEAAGGLSQIIKVVMSIRNGVMPATRSHRRLIEDQDLRPGGCRILRDNTPLSELRSHPHRRFMAAVHAYGLGGCNAHVVVEAPDAVPSRSPHAPSLPFLLSGETRQDLWEWADRLADWLARQKAPSLTDIAFTLAASRADQKCRLALMAGSPDDLAAKLRAASRSGGKPPMETGLHPKGDLAASLSRWLGGADIDWEALLPLGRRIPLAPTVLRRRDFPPPALAC